MVCTHRIEWGKDYTHTLLKLFSEAQLHKAFNEIPVGDLGRECDYKLLNFCTTSTKLKAALVFVH